MTALQGFRKGTRVVGKEGEEVTNITGSDDATIVRDLYRYIWKVSARRQVILSALAVGVFLLELAPLELQRRIVNGAVDHRDFQFIAMLCLIYVAWRSCMEASSSPSCQRWRPSYRMINAELSQRSAEPSVSS